MYYPMLKHGIDQLCIRWTPLFVLGTSGGGVRLGHKHCWFHLGCHETNFGGRTLFTRT